MVVRSLPQASRYWSEWPWNMERPERGPNTGCRASASATNRSPITRRKSLDVVRRRQRVYSRYSVHFWPLVSSLACSVTQSQSDTYDIQ